MIDLSPMPFMLKSVNPSAHVGLYLKELRERRSWTLAKASAETKLPESFLYALETERWAGIPDPLYTERILRAYVKALGGSERYLLHKYRGWLKKQKAARRPEEFLPRTSRVRALDLAVISRLAAFFGFLIFILLVGGYVYEQARIISTPPPLEVTRPSEGERVETARADVAGRTLPESTIEINGLPAMVDNGGAFSLVISLPRGMNVITVTARKRHGRTATVIRHVIYEPKN